jgi:hypothetical protein
MSCMIRCYVGMGSAILSLVAGAFFLLAGATCLAQPPVSPPLPPSLSVVSFDTHTGTFTFAVSSSASSTGVVEVSSDLRAWSSVSTNAMGAAGFQYSDVQSSLQPSRFYRVRIVPSAGGTVESQATIGPQGGTVTLPDKARVGIPEGAFAGDTTVVFRSITVSGEEADPVVGAGESVYELEFSGASPITPITFTLPVSDLTDMPDPTETLVLFQREPNGSWESGGVPVDDPEDDGEELDLLPFNELAGTVDVRLVPASPTGVGLAGVAPKKRVRVKLLRTETTLEPSSDGSTVYLYMRQVKRVEDPVSKKVSVVKTVLNQIPFRLDADLKAKHGISVFKFLLTESHSETDLVFNGKASIWPKRTIAARKTSQVSHVVLHDFGNVGTKTKPERLTAPKAVRNVVINKYPSFAQYYISSEGLVFQLTSLETLVAHARWNYTNTVGIEMEPLTLDGSFSPEVMRSAVGLTAYLLQELQLPFDPDVEKLERDRTVVTKTLRERGEKTYPKAGSDMYITSLPKNARHVSVVGHGEIQSDREDPRQFKWAEFLNAVADLMARSDVPGPGAMVDCSGPNGSTATETAGGDVTYVMDPSFYQATVPDAVFPPSTDPASTTLAGGKYSKIYIASGKTVTWDTDAGNTLECGSFYLGRGATLRLVGTTGGEATISAYRALQINGKIDAARADATAVGSKPLNLTLLSGSGELLRIPSIITRGGNSFDPAIPGGQGGNVLIMNNYADSKVVLLGRDSLASPDAFPIQYRQRTKADFRGFGGNSFSVDAGRLFWSGIVTSGGSAAGAVDTIAAGGNGGTIDLALGSGVIRFTEPFQLVSGAGASSTAQSPLELLRINYQNSLFGPAALPAGGNGGRGRISFGNLRGGDGGNGGNAGEINVSIIKGAGSWTSRRINVALIGGRASPIVNRSIFALTDSLGNEILRVSAIGGSGGPKGGDSASSFPGFDGDKGKDAKITISGTVFQESE